MTISETLKYALTKLSTKNIINPHLEAELLLSAIIKRSREYVLTHPEEKISKIKTTDYKLQITKRCKNIPTAYLTGYKNFYGFDFIVNRDVLIPRPETELMIEKTLELTTYNSQLTTQEKKYSIIIDIGTGSGCIIISLAKKINELGIKNYELWGIDISKKALKISRQNAKLNNVQKNIKFLQGNLLEPILKNNKFIPKFKNKKIIILSNLPYLTPSQIKKSPSIKYEPRLALSAGPDGLKYYRQLLKQLKIIPGDTYQGIIIFCEIDHRQTEKFINLLKKNLPTARWQIIKDLSKKNRLIKIEI
jgi:release factor glutamine methyltransferase